MVYLRSFEDFYRSSMKYPRMANGLIVPPYELGFTIPSAEQLHTRRRTTNHHGYFYHADYSRRLHSVFRNLVSNVYPLLEEEHTRLHRDFDAPIKPKDTVMIDVIDEYLSLHGVIDCVKEKRTRETYQLTAMEWERVVHGTQNITI